MECNGVTLGEPLSGRESGHTIGRGTREMEKVLSISGARNSIIPLRRIRDRSAAAVAAATTAATSHSERAQTRKEKKKGEVEDDGEGEEGGEPNHAWVSLSYLVPTRFLSPSALYFIHETANELGVGPPSPLISQRDAEKRGERGVNDFHTLGTHVNGIALIP